ncbi:sarcosine oxidase subunit gamma [Rubrimonas cliftonensis]|uniref:Sarcosine oxidase subunit gamma n=1 Tax=Rubrimonas cliftonensis TaxID=89524 RepID=A0A1H4A267_9RHOB|nr:sarcosine oxidase subunit gamma family protein [Rubrimonas cliftonensis]SEA29721.1 sarcosine oxidase subunit gamma [Rubrimonas cliftonensis]
MLDALTPALPADDPFEGLALSARAGALSIAPLPARARFVLRGGADAAQAAALGEAPPARVGAAVEARHARILKLGPDEWRLCAPMADGPALAASLAGALGGVPHSLVETTDRDCGAVVEGPLALEALSCGCPLNLAALPVPAATRTLFGQLDALILRTGPERFEVEVWRSFGAHLRLHLCTIARELDIGL